MRPARTLATLVLAGIAMGAWGQSLEQCRALEFSGGEEARSCYRELIVAADPGRPRRGSLGS